MIKKDVKKGLLPYLLLVIIMISIMYLVNYKDRGDK